MDDYQRRRFRITIVAIVAGILVVAAGALVVVRHRHATASPTVPTVTVTIPPTTMPNPDGATVTDQAFATVPTTGPPDSSESHELVTATLFAVEFSSWPADAGDAAGTIWSSAIRPYLTSDAYTVLTSDSRRFFPSSTVGYRAAAVQQTRVLWQNNGRRMIRLSVSRQRFTVDPSTGRRTDGATGTVTWDVTVEPGYPYTLISDVSAPKAADEVAPR